MRKLGSKQIEAMLKDLNLGMSARSVGANLGVSDTAVSYWRPYSGLNAKWLDRVKIMEEELKRLRRHNDGLRRQVKLAGLVITGFEPSAKKMSTASERSHCQRRF